MKRTRAALVLQQREPLELLRVRRPRIGFELRAPLSFLELADAQVPAAERIDGTSGHPESTIASAGDCPDGLGRWWESARCSPTAAFKEAKLSGGNRPQAASGVTQDLSDINGRQTPVGAERGGLSVVINECISPIEAQVV